MARGTHRPTVAKVDLGAIKWNINQIRNHIRPGKKLLAVVKADGYGHGAVPIANAAKEAGVDGFCVAILDEAIELRQNGFTEDFLLVMGVTEVRDVALMADSNISVTVSSFEWLEAALPLLHLRKTMNPLRIHLAVDTGMGRIGLRTKEEVQAFEAFCEKYESLHLEGIFTHFATADGEDDIQVERQYETVKELVKSMTTRPDMVHLANSAMTLWHEDFETDATRVGIAMYGYNPSDLTIPLPYELKPAFTLETEISYVKQMHEGDTISYGARYKAYEGEWLATLPIGYADGWRRDLGNQTLLVDGHRCPVRGVVCMDQLMISLPHAYPIGTKVTLLGENNGEWNNPSEMAVELGTIGYEILCGISDRVPRIYNDSKGE